ncbi:FAD-dependent monooxygenase [Taibaiella soli]|nr:FAD-dependent monooxygenase [Taibaiella soli]
MKAIIIGGGIGGLTAGIALQKRGIDYEVFESAPEIRPVGAGIWLGGNAMNVFEKLGVADAIKSCSYYQKEIFIKDYRGSILQRVDNELIRQKYGNGTYSIHRAALQEVLAAEVGTKLHTGKKCTGIYQHTSGVTAHFEDGTQVHGDFVIAADGIRSVIREKYVTKAVYRYSGQTCWRAIVHMNLPREEQNQSAEIWGYDRGLRASYSQVGKEQVYFWVTIAMEKDSHFNNMDAHRQIKKWLQPFSGYNLQTVVRNIQPELLIHSDLYDIKPVDKWYAGNIVLLGDAAHATTPNLGQGAGQAIEDAYVLAACLEKEPDQPQAAFANYQNKRIKRTQKVVDISWKLAQMTNIGNPALRHIRNWIIKATPNFVTQKQFDLLYGIDLDS